MWILLTIVIVIVVIMVLAYQKSKQLQQSNLQIEEHLKSNGFNIGKALHQGKNHFLIDDVNHKVYISSNNQNGKIFDYKDIIDFELIEDGQSLTKGTAGKAAIGALTFGVAGAIVGASMKNQKNMCTNMQLIITVDDVIDSNIVMQLIDNTWVKDGIEKNSIIYKSAFEFGKNVTSTLAAIKNKCY